MLNLKTLMTPSVSSSIHNSEAPVLTETDALWEHIRLQFREAYRLEQLGDSESSISWIQEKVTPAVQAWSSKVSDSSDKKKQMLRLLFDEERRNPPSAPLHESQAPKDSFSSKETSEPSRQSSRELLQPARPSTGRRPVNNPYASQYQRVHQQRPDAKRVPLGNIADMIDAVHEEEYAVKTGK